jgi:hypothetical protein
MAGLWAIAANHFAGMQNITAGARSRGKDLASLMNMYMGAVMGNGTVYHVSKTGEDKTVAGWGTSWDKAFLTIQAALNVCAAHDTVMVAPGDYGEDLVTRDATDGRNYGVRLIGMRIGRSMPRIYPATPLTKSALWIRTRGFTLSGFKISCGTGVAAGVSVTYQYDRDETTGVFSFNAASANLGYEATIEDCFFAAKTPGTTCGGLDLCGSSFDVTVRNCLFQHLHIAGNTARAIYSGGAAFNIVERCFFIGNTFVECDKYIDFASAGGSRGCVIQGNHFMATSSVVAYNCKPKINLAGAGIGNLVQGNFMGGTYTAAAAEYIPATGGTDNWGGNFTAAGMSTGVPA